MAMRRDGIGITNVLREFFAVAVFSVLTMRLWTTCFLQ